MRRLKPLVIALGLQLVLVVSASAQEVRYIYDPLGRLIGVIDQTGTMTIYDYDAVGNLLAIRRPDGAASVVITLVTPAIGLIGTPVDIVGSGFSGVPGENHVAFNGVAAVVLTATSNHLTTLVPVGATSGSVTVTTPSGSATSPQVFSVPRITVVPSQATVALGKLQQFTASIGDMADQRVVWLVDGIEGGSPIVGTISAEGIYKAPSTVPTAQAAQIEARSVAFPSLVGKANIAIPVPGTAVMAMPADIRVVRPALASSNGLAVNVTVAQPPSLSVVRSGTGESGVLPNNVTVATPPFMTLVRPGTGSDGGSRANIIAAAPPSVTLVRPGDTDSSRAAPNVTVAQPHDIRVTPQPQ